MPRKRRILKHHILDAALELMREEEFDRFTARKIAECLNASTQPIYKEFKNMDDLKVNLTAYVQDKMDERIFKLEDEQLQIRDVCKNYILFSKNEGCLFAALFMGREVNATTLHAYIFDQLHHVLDRHEKAKGRSREDKDQLLNILWPAVHGFAILTAQGKYELPDEELIEKINHIVDSSVEVWSQSLPEQVN